MHGDALVWSPKDAATFMYDVCLADLGTDEGDAVIDTDDWSDAIVFATADFRRTAMKVTLIDYDFTFLWNSVPIWNALSDTNRWVCPLQNTQHS